jgi:hypothetical protein
MFKLNPQYLSNGVIVVDDFYDDPHQVREIALKSEYYEPGSSNGFKHGDGPFPGIMSKKPFLPRNLNVELSQLLSKKIYGKANSDHGYFRISQYDPSYPNPIHYDSIHGDLRSHSLVAIVYLSLPEHYGNRVGTSFYRHLPTNLEYVKDRHHDNQVQSSYVTVDETKLWEETCSVSFKFNRLVMYPPSLFHRIGPLFGDSVETARLVQLFTWGEF